MENTRDAQVVYHYTSADTLLKIVYGNTIWASGIRYLNDVSENDYCLHLLRSRISEFVRVYDPPNGRVLEITLAGISTQERTSAPYVASFSLHRDSLPQWRSYCPNGNGVSIGFNVSALTKATLTRELLFGSIQPATATLDRVQYVRIDDSRTQDGILFDCIRELQEWHSGHDYDADPDGFSDANMLDIIIRRRAVLVKHAGFESEQEYRLIAPYDYMIPNAVKFRSSRTTIIPYVEMLMPLWGRAKDNPNVRVGMVNDYFIHEVLVGPTPNPTLTKNALSELFGRMGVPVYVNESTIPYRDL